MRLSKVNHDRTMISALLIAGSCIGAGMLSLPIVTGLVGFLPTTVILMAAWLYMLITAKLLVEANAWFPDRSINVLTLSMKILGPLGKWFASGLFLFLFYSLLTAYFVKGGELLYQIALNRFGSPRWGIFILFGITYFIVYRSTHWVLKVNALFMYILFFSFFALLMTAMDYIHPNYLNYRHYEGIWFLIPFLITSFGFHNMIASIRDYLDRDDSALVKAIHIGSAIPLLIYFLWLFVMLSVLPLAGEHGIIESFKQNHIATEPLGVITGSDKISHLATAFSFSAIITSILGQSLSVADFFRDAFAKDHKASLPLILTFLPPFLFSQLGPQIFFQCLSIAGGIAAILLYGFLPGLIVLRGRYHEQLTGAYQHPGGKSLLYGVMLIALAIFCLEVAKNLAWITLY